MDDAIELASNDYDLKKKYDFRSVEIVRQYAADIVEYSRGIKDIVVDLTGYSRTADREYLTRVDLRQVVEDALRLVQRSRPCDGVVFENEIEPGLSVQAKGNELQQVFINLVKNSVEAMLETEDLGRQPIVRITGGASSGGTWVDVGDNGPGIPEEAQAVVFDPFFTTKAPGRGTGLGLNIVYRILTKYQGTVTLESTVGTGTTFHLRFPAQP